MVHPVRAANDEQNALLAPSISPVDGTYYDTVTVTLGTSKPRAKIMYTVDGSDPEQSPSALAYSAAVTLTHDTTIRAVVLSAGVASEQSSASYTLKSSASETWTAVATPSEDDTANIQSALDKGGFVHIPDGIYTVGPLFVHADTVLRMSPNTVLRAKSGAFPGIRDSLLNLSQVSNVAIYGNGARIEMLRNEYEDGEWRMGVAITSSDRVYIERLASNGSGGDGFYVGTARREKGQPIPIAFSINIALVGVTAANNKRLGLAITSGKNISVANSTFTTSKGAWPQAGIDLEPNSRKDEMTSIVLDHVRTENNHAYGIVIALSRLAKSGKQVDIAIRNHQDVGSIGGFVLMNVYGKLAGQITVTTPTWKNSRAAGFWARNYPVQAPRVDLVQPVVIDPNSPTPGKNPYGGSGPEFHGFAAAYAVTWYQDPKTTREVGNIHFFQPKVIETRTPSRTLYGFIFYDPRRSLDVADIDLISPQFEGVPEDRRLFFYGLGTIKDANNMLAKHLDGVTTVEQAKQPASPTSPTYTLFHNERATAIKTLQLGAVPVGYPDIRVEVRAAEPIRIIAEKGIRIKRDGANIAGYLESATPGSVVRLRKTGPRVWQIITEQGNWIEASSSS